MLKKMEIVEKQLFAPVERSAKGVPIEDQILLLRLQCAEMLEDRDHELENSSQ